MLKSANKIETNKYEIEAEASAQEFEAAVQTAYNKRKNRIAIPGFRKGKAPRKMIEKLYGEAFFYDDAVNALLPIIVGEAITEAKLEPVARPQVEITSLSKDTGVRFKAVVVSKPEVEISDYKGIEVEKTVKDITDEDVDKEIDRIRQRQGRLVTVEGRNVENGDVTVIDFKGFINGEPFEGGEEKNYELKIGSGYFIPGFEEQIIGHAAGDEFTVNVTFPENYQMTEVAGKPAEFSIKLHEIKSLELPEVDDEFVKDVSEFDTLDEFKKDLKTKLTERAAKEAETASSNKLFETLTEKMTAEIPQEMYESKIDELIDEFRARLSMQNLTLDMYLSYMNMSEKSFRETFRDPAEKQVKLRLALEKIAELENIQISDEEVEEEIGKIAEKVGMTPDQVKARVTTESVRDDLKSAEAAKIVKESAKFSA